MRRAKIVIWCFSYCRCTFSCWPPSVRRSHYNAVNDGFTSMLRSQMRWHVKWGLCRDKFTQLSDSTSVSSFTLFVLCVYAICTLMSVHNVSKCMLISTAADISEWVTSSLFLCLPWHFLFVFFWFPRQHILLIPKWMIMILVSMS